jgi:superoxide dismutase, Fe-Mn family
MFVNSSISPGGSAVPEDDHNASRREFLGRGAAAGLALAMWGGVAAGANEPAAGDAGRGSELYPGAVDASGKYVLPPLPYDYAALEPHIDTETMKLHHDKHHAGYVKGLIAAEEELNAARTGNKFEAIQSLSSRQAFHGGGHFLHCIFWAEMAPEGKGGNASGALSGAIDKSFGSMDAFKAQFSGAATSVEGSGWAIMAWSIAARKLVVLQSEKHDNLTQWANIPLLVLDMWEHAFYKKYGPAKADYVKAFWNVVNWENVSRRFEIASSLG